jgi:succinyl-CoA synthetase beta subunit
MVEINPMIETPQNTVLCADAKVNIDDNADFKQSELFALRDITQEDPRDIRASKAGLNYIGLDGNIGCIVNGAGLAMATMDIIKLYGGSPANFLDVGGGATQGQISEALKILNEDKQVTAILVNIFGGIARCDMIALGLISAVTEISLSTPLVVRLQGTNVDKAKEILEKSGIRVIPADNLDDAAEKAVRVAKIVQEANSMKMKVLFELPI